MTTFKMKSLLNTCLILTGLLSAISSTCIAQVQQVITLDQAIQMGMDYSHQLEASRGKYEYTKAKHDQTYDLGYPVSFLSANYSRLSDVPEFTLPGSEEPLFPVFARK